MMMQEETSCQFPLTKKPAQLPCTEGEPKPHRRCYPAQSRHRPPLVFSNPGTQSDLVITIIHRRPRSPAPPTQAVPLLPCPPQLHLSAATDLLCLPVLRRK
jgi:hypothetical protein